MPEYVNVEYDTLIPNNVKPVPGQACKEGSGEMASGLHQLVERPDPQEFQKSLVYLRTAVSVDPKGWAKF